jgi:uncharacterized radical SAM superfamily Fe-S cluster-containing enzyme
LRNYRPDKAPPGFDLQTLLKQFLSQTGAAHSGEDDAKQFEWRVLFVAGMWFQDLFNYDFRRTEMCIIPYGTQLGEISVLCLQHGRGLAADHREDEGQRHRAEWYKEHGRHPIYARNQDVELPEPESPLTVKEHPLALKERADGRRVANKRRTRLPIIST